MYPQKRQVNVAVSSKRKHDLSHPHIGTIDFGVMKPIECRYMVPGDEFNINLGSEFRALNGLPSPTIGQMDVVYRSFFVPLHNVWSPLYDFLKNQQTISNGELVNVENAPYIILGEFLEFVLHTSFEGYNLVEMLSSTPSSRTEYDFSRYDNVGQGVALHYYKFTREGRILVNFLTSLGINIPWATRSDSSAVNQKLYIVLPLVCFWKFYYDWIVPSRFIRKHQYYIETFISKLTNDVALANNKVDIEDFYNYLCAVPYAYFLDDFFTTSTEFPFQSDEPLNTSITLSNPSSQSSVDQVKVNSSPTENLNGSYVHEPSTRGQFNMYTLQTLGKLQDLLNRNLIAGTKVQDWLLTEFGLKPNNDALHLSTYLGSKRFTLEVRDVVSNADTEAQGGVSLGAYGGYIRSQSNFDFNYKANEHGFYFITCELVPRTHYYQGLQAQFDMGDRYDFFQPEFDNQQAAPIPFRRLFFSQDDALQGIRFDSKFGFQLQYADLKIAPAVISGDLRTRFGLSLKSWYLARDVSYIENPDLDVDGIEEEFCLVKSKYQDWHYIFNDMTDELDPFICAFYFNAPNCMRPMKSVTEGFEPTYKNGNKEIALDFSGSVK